LVDYETTDASGTRRTFKTFTDRDTRIEEEEEEI